MCDTAAPKPRAPLGLAVALCLAAAACGGKGGGSASDGAADASDGATGERPIVLCPEVDGGTESDAAPADDAGAPTTDEFGHNAPAKTASSLGRVNVYEITSTVMLERVDVYLRADQEATRLTIAIQEATTRTGTFRKLADVQMDFDSCQGWATSGALAIPLVVGRYYAIGFDPNQVIVPFVNTDTDTLPIDGVFGRLIGSRTANSVSITNLNWDKFTDKEYNRQRLRTSPRAPDPVPDGGVDATDGSTDAAGDGRG